MYIVGFELRYIMVGRFARKHFWCGFLNEKMTVWLNGGTEDLSSPLDVLEVCDNLRVC